jgi:hypothetical protein
MSNQIKYKRVFASPGGDPSLPARVTALENNEYEVTYFEQISSDTGTVTPPTGATILLDQFEGGVDAYVSTLDTGDPTGENPVTAGGVVVDVASFNSGGTYSLTGIPSSYPVALIYVFKIKAIDWSNVNPDNIVDYDQTDFVTLSGEQTLTNKTLTDAIVGTQAAGDNSTKAASTAYVDTAVAAKTPMIGPFVTSGSWADSSTYYATLGALSLANTPTNADNNLGFACTIIGAIVTVSNNSTTGSSENATVQLRNTTTATSHLIGTFTTDASTSVCKSFTFTGLNIPVAAIDEICPQIDTPAWATNPVGSAIRIWLIYK